MKDPLFTGVATAIVTPFAADGSVDLGVFDRLLRAQLAAGIDAIVVCGTTGESSTLTEQEQLSLIAHAVEYAAGRCKIIAGTGSNSTAHALALSRAACALGADGLLLVTPYYNKCTQEGLLAHYFAIADAVTCPIIVYSVPSRTGLDISVETCVRLSTHPNLNGIKEAGGDTAKAARILQRCGDAFHLWSGNDDQIAPLMALGAKGVISVLSNVRPHKTMALTHAALRGDYQTAGQMQCACMPLVDALFCEVNPIPVKRALELEGFPVGAPRLPLTPLSESNRPRLAAALGTW